MLTAHRLRRDDGFTLVELMVSMTIMTVVGGMMVAGLLTGYRSVRSGEERLDALRASQSVMEQVSRELRAASSEPTALDIALADQVRTEVDRLSERYRFEWRVENGDLVEERWTLPGGAGTTRVLVEGVANGAGDPVFTYLDADDNPTSTLSDIRVVRIALEHELSNRQPVRVETLVRLRNAGGL